LHFLRRYPAQCHIRSGADHARVSVFRPRTEKILAACYSLGRLDRCRIVVVDNLIKYDGMRASRMYPVRSLIVYDLGGITFFSGEDASDGLFGNEFVQRNAGCYSAKSAEAYLFWDCKDYGQALLKLMSDENTRSSVYRRWIGAIVTHPFAYLRHRIGFFNKLMQVYCPDCAHAPTSIIGERPYDTITDKRVTAPALVMERFAMRVYLGWTSRGIFWMLALGATAMALIPIVLKRRDRFAFLALFIAASGLAYGGAFFFIGFRIPYAICIGSIS
jgi:hypothetical protein